MCRVLLFLLVVFALPLQATDAISLKRLIVSSCLLEEAACEKVFIAPTVRFPGCHRIRKKWEVAFIGRPIDQALQHDVLCAVQSVYRDASCPLVSVYIPEQEITDGVLRVCVRQATVGSVYCGSGSCQATRAVPRALRLRPGCLFSLRKLEADLAWVNRNPFRCTEAVLRSGECPGTTDVTLFTRACRPISAYYGWDNRGNAAIGQFRQFAGVQASGCLVSDDLVLAQVTLSADPQHLYAFSGSYELPLRWRHLMWVYGAYNHVKSKRMDRDFRSRGFNLQGSARYKVPYCLRTCLWQEWSVGFDYKQTNNDVLFVTKDPIFGPRVRLTQGVLGWRMDRCKSSGTTSASCSLYVSPAQFLTNQNSAAYSLLRPGAKARYAYIRGYLSHCCCLGRKWAVEGKTAFQGASTTLLPSEELVICSADGVRGYPEKELIADSGFYANLELRRAFNFGKCGCFKALIFFDYGMGIQNRNPPGDTTSKGAEAVMGVGPGIRYNWGNCLCIRADAGFALRSLRSMDGLSRRIYLTAQGNF